MDAPRNTTRLARRVRQRATVSAALRRAGLGLVVGSALGLGAVLTHRAGWWRPDERWGIAWWMLVAAPAAAGLLLGAAAGLLGRGSLLAAAQRADRALGLRDRLSNALAFAPTAAGPAEQLAIRDAERLAESLSPARVVPIRLGSTWAVWPVVLAGAVAAGLWVPQRQAPVVQAAHQPTEPQRQAAADRLATAVATTRELLPDSLRDRAAQEHLDRVAELERELLDGAVDPDAALAEGAREIDRFADRIDRDAEQAALTDQAAREQLADQLTGREPDSELARALAEGDLQGARDAAADLLDRFERMDPAERERYAEELDRLADQLQSAQVAEPTPGPGPDAPNADPSSLDEMLRQQGIDHPQSLPESADPEQLQQELEDRGVEPDTARDLAEQLAERNQQRQAEEQAEQDLNKLSEDLRDAADQLREPPSPQPDPPENPSEPEQPDEQNQPQQRDPPQDQQRQGERQGQQQNPAAEGTQGQQQQDQPQQSDQQGEGEQQRPGAQPTPRQQQQPGQQPGREQQGTDSPDGKPGGDRQSQPKPGQEAPAQRPGTQPGIPPDTQPGTQPDTQPDAKPGENPTPQPGDRPGREPLPQPGDQPDSPSRMTDGSGEAPDARGIEQLRRQLERMADRPGEAERNQQSARELREQAERMLEQATPEQRRELEQLAEEIASRRGPGDRLGNGADRADRTEQGPRPAPQREWGEQPFDARATTGDEQPREGQVIADWYSDDKPAQPAGPTPASGPAFQQATRSAERALERRAVPRERQELVRRVFERFRQRASEGQPANPSADKPVEKPDDR